MVKSKFYAYYPSFDGPIFSVNEHRNATKSVFLADKTFVRQTTDLIMN